MKIEVKKFKDLSVDEIYEILKLRSEVFVVEQECAYQDIDGKDKKAMHLMGKKDNEIVAYTRILDSGDCYELPSIARVVVKKKTRGEERGKEIMKESIKYIKENLQEKTIVLAAQKYLDKFSLMYFIDSFIISFPLSSPRVFFFTTTLAMLGNS
jgi:ElaA protein